MAIPTVIDADGITCCLLVSTTHANIWHPYRNYKKVSGHEVQFTHYWP